MATDPLTTFLTAPGGRSMVNAQFPLKSGWPSFMCAALPATVPAVCCPAAHNANVTTAAITQKKRRISRSSKSHLQNRDREGAVRSSYHSGSLETREHGSSHHAIERRFAAAEPFDVGPHDLRDFVIRTIRHARDVGRRDDVGQRQQG